MSSCFLARGHCTRTLSLQTRDAPKQLATAPLLRHRARGEQQGDMRASTLEGRMPFHCAWPDLACSLEQPRCNVGGLSRRPILCLCVCGSARARNSHCSYSTATGQSMSSVHCKSTLTRAIAPGFHCRQVGIPSMVEQCHLNTHPCQTQSQFTQSAMRVQEHRSKSIRQQQQPSSERLYPDKRTQTFKTTKQIWGWTGNTHATILPTSSKFKLSSADFLQKHYSCEANAEQKPIPCEANAKHQLIPHAGSPADCCNVPPLSSIWACGMAPYWKGKQNTFRFLVRKQLRVRPSFAFEPVPSSVNKN